MTFDDIIEFWSEWIGVILFVTFVALVIWLAVKAERNGRHAKAVWMQACVGSGEQWWVCDERWTIAHHSDVVPMPVIVPVPTK